MQQPGPRLPSRSAWPACPPAGPSLPMAAATPARAPGATADSREAPPRPSQDPLRTPGPCPRPVGTCSPRPVAGASLGGLSCLRHVQAGVASLLRRSCAPPPPRGAQGLSPPPAGPPAREELRTAVWRST
nr:uncharacterized protein LOC127493923 [Oryctolagus cuniculus]